MADNDSSDGLDFDEVGCKRWTIPSFLVRNYHFGYERECHDLLFGGEHRKGARDTEIEQETIIIDVLKRQ